MKVDYTKLPQEFRRLYYDGKETDYIVGENGTVINTKTSNMISANTDKNGRYRIGIQIEGKQKVMSLHHVVYMAYYGPVPKGMTVNHIDEDKENNHYTNLELMTHSDNIKSYVKNNPTVKVYSDTVIEELCKYLKAGVYYKYIAIAYDFDIAYMYSIAKGKKRKFIVDKYLPFPSSCVDRTATQYIPKEFFGMLIQRGFSNNEILDSFGLKRDKTNAKMLVKLRQRYGMKNPNRDSMLTKKVDQLIMQGKANKDIRDMLDLKKCHKTSWLLSHERKKLGVEYFNPDGISRETKLKIIDDINAGMTNDEIIAKHNLEKTSYCLSTLGNLRYANKKKKTLPESSSTIETIGYIAE